MWMFILGLFVGSLISVLTLELVIARANRKERETQKEVAL